MAPVAQPALTIDTMPIQNMTARYVVLGVPIAVISNVAEALERVDDTYTAFRQDNPSMLESSFTAELLSDTSGRCAVRDTRGYQREWADAHTATLDLLDRIVHGILTELHKRDMYAIHAGALVYRGSALIIAGRSGQGKTTLTLGLLSRGLGLLSDEFAVIGPANERIMPYRRSMHVRPGTPEIIPALQFLAGQPRHQLGGGIEWSLSPQELARVFPGCLANAAPLRYVLLLDGAPQPDQEPIITAAPAALATIDLLRGTWAASRDFTSGLARMSQLMHGATCARLRAGQLETTLDAVGAWLEAHHG